jgi:hypothetical protein
LNLLAPILLGVLKNRTQGAGANANGLATLFTEQRQNIMSAMPNGLSNQLANVPGMSDVADWVRSTTGSAYQAGRVATSEAGRTISAAAATGSSALRWVLPLLAVLIVGGLLWWWGSRSTPQLTTLATPPTLGTDHIARLTGQTTDFFRMATDTFTGIKDVASAEAAAPKIRALSTQLDTLRGALQQLPAGAQTGLITLVKEQGTKLLATVDAVMSVPAIRDTLKPAVDDLRSKLHALGTA